MLTLRFSGFDVGIAGPTIRLATWSWCSHVDLELPDGSLLGAVPGAGVVQRLARPDVGRVGRYAVDLLPAKARYIIDLAATQIGRSYDWPGILGWALRRDWQDRKRWFCSELVAWAFQRADHPLLRADHAWRITPRDLLLSPHLRPVPSAHTAQA